MHKNGGNKIVNLYKFFDYFGLIIFTFLLIDAIYDLKKGEKNWRIYLRLSIGILGLLVDSFLVFFYKHT